MEELTDEKILDKSIIKRISSIVQEMIDKTDILEYRAQLEERKLGLQVLFEDFNSNMEAIRSHDFYSSHSHQEEPPSLKAMDAVVRKRIEENLYHADINPNGMVRRPTPEQVSQISDRLVGVIEFLENFDENMGILNKLKEDRENPEKS